MALEARLFCRPSRTVSAADRGDGLEPVEPGAADRPHSTNLASGLIESVKQAGGALLTPSGMVGAALEGAWIGAHLALYPFGHLRFRSSSPADQYRLEHLPPTRRGLTVQNVEAANTPILLIHGLIDNRSIFTVLERGLVRRGFGQVMTMNYSVFTGDVRVAAARLAEEVERICEESGYERIHIIGHSMGGLIARYYVTRLGGDEHVHTLVTLGTPHSGTYLAYGWSNGLTRQLRPGSKLLAELDRPIASCRTRFVVFWSDLDQVVLPQHNAALHHPDLSVHNVEVHGVGHMSLPISTSVVHEITAALAHVDAHGVTVVPAVTPMGRSSRSGRAARAGTRGAGRSGDDRGARDTSDLRRAASGRARARQQQNQPKNSPGNGPGAT